MLGWGGPEGSAAASEATIDLPAAVARAWFPPIDDYENGGGALDDEQFTELMAALDAAMSAEETAADFAGEASYHLANFGRRLAVPRITEPQQEEIAAFLTVLGERHPDHRQLIDRQKSVLTPLYSPKSTDDIPVFSRRVDLLLSDSELYADGDFEDGQVDRILATLRAMSEDAVLLSVNSDPVLDTIQAVKVRESLDYRTWWDGHGEVSTEGPIATAWHVAAWPTIYILDEEGVIRFVNKRGADMIATVDGLLKEKRWAALEASMLAPAGDGAGEGK